MNIASTSYQLSGLQSWSKQISSYTEATNFIATLAAAEAVSQAREGTDDDGKPSPQKLEKFKSDFYNQLANLPLSPGLTKAKVTVQITDAAFEKMMADPEFKDEMLALCKRDLCDPAWSKLPPDYQAITIDEKNGYLARSGASGTEKPASGKEFWQNDPANKKKTKRKDEQQDKLMEYLEQRALDRKTAAEQIKSENWYKHFSPDYSTSIRATTKSSF